MNLKHYKQSLCQPVPQFKPFCATCLRDGQDSELPSTHPTEQQTSTEDVRPAHEHVQCSEPQSAPAASAVRGVQREQQCAAVCCREGVLSPDTLDVLAAAADIACDDTAHRWCGVVMDG